MPRSLKLLTNSCASSGTGARVVNLARRERVGHRAVGEYHTSRADVPTSSESTNAHDYELLVESDNRK